MAVKHDTTKPLEYQTLQGQMNILGFWIFIGAEIILFGTLFAVYSVLGNRYVGGPTPEDIFVVRDVVIQTLLLLTSSFTVGIVIWAMRNNNLKALIFWQIITLLLGIGFLYMEINEFIHYVNAGATLQTSAFLSSMYALLGMHGAHVTLGIGWGTGLIFQLRKRGIAPETATKTHIFSLYWHFLDVVWIFVFTFVYLGGLV